MARQHDRFESAEAAAARRRYEKIAYRQELAVSVAEVERAAAEVRRAEPPDDPDVPDDPYDTPILYSHRIEPVAADVLPSQRRRHGHGTSLTYRPHFARLQVRRLLGRLGVSTRRHAGASSVQDAVLAVFGRRAALAPAGEEERLRRQTASELCLPDAVQAVGVYADWLEEAGGGEWGRRLRNTAALMRWLRTPFADRLATGRPAGV